MGNILHTENPFDDELIDSCPDEINVDVIVEPTYTPKPIFMENSSPGESKSIPVARHTDMSAMVKHLEEYLETMEVTEPDVFIDSLSDYIELFENTDPKLNSKIMKVLVNVSTLAMRILNPNCCSDVILQFIDQIMFLSKTTNHKNALRITNLYVTSLETKYDQCATRIISSVIRDANINVLPKLARQALITATMHPEYTRYCIETIVMRYIGTVEWETTSPSDFRMLTSLIIESEAQYLDLHKTLMDILLYDVTQYRNGDNVLNCYLAVYLTASYENKLDVVPIVSLIENLLTNDTFKEPESAEIIEAIVQDLITTFNNVDAVVTILTKFATKLRILTHVNGQTAIKLLKSAKYYTPKIAPNYIRLACTSTTKKDISVLYNILLDMLLDTDEIMTIMQDIMTVHADIETVCVLYYKLLNVYVGSAIFRGQFHNKTHKIEQYVALALYPTPDAPRSYSQAQREGIMSLYTLLMVTRDQFKYYDLFAQEVHNSWKNIVVSQTDREYFLDKLAKQVDFIYTSTSQITITDESVKIVKRLLQDYKNQ